MDENESPKIPPEIQKIAEIIESLSEDPKFVEAMQNAYRAGFEVNVVISAEMKSAPDPPAPPELKEPKPLVKDGAVIPGAFTPFDQNLCKGWIRI